MSRKLVSVQVIKALEPIKGADFIEQATVLGWSLVVKKGEFRVGDKCAFFEIDSVLPEEEWSEFMRPSKFRVRTKKMKGILSQGLALPLTAIGLTGEFDTSIDSELTELIGVTKYEPPVVAQLAGDQEGSFPWFVPKTDETRLQSVPNVLNELQGKEVYIAVKLDGTSATYAKTEDKFYVCSRNFSMKPGPTVYWTIADKYELNKIPAGFAVQGEICGPGIQKNRLGLKESQFFAFNVYDIQAGTYLSYREFILFCQNYNIPTVPIEAVTEFNISTVADVLEYAKGKYVGTNNHREGLVIRPTTEMYSSVLNGRLSVKAINNDFLLKGGED